MNTRFTQHCLSLMISLLLLPAVNGHTAETTRVSVDSAEQPGQPENNSSLYPAISADGRFVAFASYTPLVAGDTNDEYDIFVRDRIAGTTTRVSVNSEGGQGNSGSVYNAISADGRFVTFTSQATNLVSGDTNASNDIFVHDRNTGTTTRVSVDSAGGQGNAESANPVISADGRFVAFTSAASNLVTGDTNEWPDIFVHDRSTGTTTRVSVNSTGFVEGIYSSLNPSISADGRFVAFTSEASNLITGDTNGWSDILVHDRTTGVTTRVSVDSSGVQGNHYSFGPAISADGRWVAFSSKASNLVAGDTNDGGTTFALDGVDYFVHDRITGTTTRVSVNSEGEQQNSYSNEPTVSISADGRFVTFPSAATNLVAGDTNTWEAIFVHDRATGSTTRASVKPADELGMIRGSGHPAISADGRFVTFDSNYLHLPPGDTFFSAYEVFVRDRLLIRNKTADLQLAVTSQPASVQADQSATYVYTLTNNGPDSIDKASKLIAVTANGSVLSLTPSQGNCKKAVVSICNFGSLANGASVTLTAAIKATSDPITQQVSVNAPPVDNVPDNNSLTVSTPVTP